MSLSLILQIFILSFDAPLERKASATLTISMVVAGSDLRVALNGMSACQAAFTSKKAIKYLGMVWGRHPDVLWRSS
ncbi:MAG: hypothetical protein WA220_09235 [Candidatus Nitrosopolaris sp.]